MRHLRDKLLNKQSILEQQMKDTLDNEFKELLEKNENFWKNDDVSAKKSLFSSEIQSDKLILLKNYNDLIIEKFPDARLMLEVKKNMRFLCYFLRKNLFYLRRRRSLFHLVLYLKRKILILSLVEVELLDYCVLVFVKF